MKHQRSQTWVHFELNNVEKNHDHFNFNLDGYFDVDGHFDVDGIICYGICIKNVQLMLNFRWNVVDLSVAPLIFTRMSLIFTRIQYATDCKV